MEWLIAFIVLFFLYRLSPETFSKLDQGLYPHDKTENRKNKLPDFFTQNQTNLRFISAKDKQAYLKSIGWQELKNLRILFVGRQCEVPDCTETENLHLHHTTYERLTQEDVLGDVVLLCPKHHQKIHDKLGYDRITDYPLNKIDWSK